MSDGGASNTLTHRYINKMMLPDRRMMMKSLGFSYLSQKLNIFLWLAKMHLKVFINKFGLFRVR